MLISCDDRVVISTLEYEVAHMNNGEFDIDDLLFVMMICADLREC